jgi:hypothetical protein
MPAPADRSTAHVMVHRPFNGLTVRAARAAAHQTNDGDPCKKELLDLAQANRCPSDLNVFKREEAEEFAAAADGPELKDTGRKT